MIDDLNHVCEPSLKATRNKCIASSNKCHATSNRCLTSINKKLLIPVGFPLVLAASPHRTQLGLASLRSCPVRRMKHGNSRDRDSHSYIHYTVTLSLYIYIQLYTYEVFNIVQEPQKSTIAGKHLVTPNERHCCACSQYSFSQTTGRFLPVRPTTPITPISDPPTTDIRGWFPSLQASSPSGRGRLLGEDSLRHPRRHQGPPDGTPPMAGAPVLRAVSVSNARPRPAGGR